MTVTGQPGPEHEARSRARDLGITIGRLPPGRWNAITDVPGVRVGHCTITSDGAPRGTVRTGVTIVLPNDNPRQQPVFAGFHVLNGCGEVTGLSWIGESGFLTSPIALTGTRCVGSVHDALIALNMGWLPVVAETWDGFLSDVQDAHVRLEHVRAALEGAGAGPVAEGSVGGGTGMICHGFKGGIGTASRRLPAEAGGWTVGVLVQANHGQRRLLRVDGVPVGQEIGWDEVPDPYAPPESPAAGTGSIIIIAATDAPLLPTQCRRLAQRAALGVARTGGLGENFSGDIFLAFSTGNQKLLESEGSDGTTTVQMLANDRLDPLFEAVAEATEEAIVNALCAATTTSGTAGRTAHAIPLDRLHEIMQRHQRPVR